MRPTTIPDTEVWAGAARIVFAAPDGDLAGAPVWLTFWGAMVPWSINVAEVPQ